MQSSSPSSRTVYGTRAQTLLGVPEVRVPGVEVEVIGGEVMMVSLFKTYSPRRL